MKGLGGFWVCTKRQSRDRRKGFCKWGAKERTQVRSGQSITGNQKGSENRYPSAQCGHCGSLVALGVFLGTQGNVDGLGVGAERVQKKELTKGRILSEGR